MDTESKTKLRRRLLKGGLAGPAVFTLQSGSAWAQSMRCSEKPLSVQPISLANSPDEFVRTRLDVLRLAKDGNELPGTYVSGRDGTYYMISGATGMKATPVAFMQQLARKTQFTRGVGITETPTGQQILALMRFDLDGTFVGYAIEGVNGTAVTPSCLLSVNPGAFGAAQRGRV